ncbi:hypothetical protein PIB30_057968 [Stylosanthes scabra]|uniref:Transposase MuDR plant domain-containing protein n=2 Tax=Stylosanthes scabra TaxID=79078 RepID=A0ABU6RK33_9FABA|nr:hypothetical protein [Stylosanthes scabra]
MNISDFVVVTLYPNGEMGRDADGIWFRSVSPVVFQMQPVNTLEELKCVILRNIAAAGAMPVRRVAYRLLNLFPLNQFKFKIFWVDSDAHVRAMFELHRRYGSREVMELLTEMETANVDAAGPSSSFGAGPGAIIAAPIRTATPERKFVPESQARQGFLLPAPSPIPDLSSVGSHFHTLNLDEMTEVQREGFGGGGEDYDLDGGSEFQIGHRFSTREAVHMAVKNYNIRRASEYRVVESGPDKYVCRCKRYDAGCPWSLRVALRTNLGYWITNQGAGDVPLVVQPVQPFRVLRVSLRGCGSRDTCKPYLGVSEPEI